MIKIIDTDSIKWNEIRSNNELYITKEMLERLEPPRNAEVNHYSRWNKMYTHLGGYTCDYCKHTDYVCEQICPYCNSVMINYGIEGFTND